MAWPMLPISPMTDETLMMRPLPRSSHVPQRRLGQVEGAGEVDVDDLAPVVVGHLEHGPVGGDARVVDQDVEPAVLVDDLLDRPPAVVGIADVALVDADRPARGTSARRPRGSARPPRRCRCSPAATAAPWLARLRQIAAPMPRVPPVTKATRPSSLLPATAVPGSGSAWAMFGSSCVDESVVMLSSRKGPVPGGGRRSRGGAGRGLILDPWAAAQGIAAHPPGVPA